MNYCLIEDAWGKNVEPMKNNDDCYIKINSPEPPPKVPEHFTEHFTGISKYYNSDCDKIIAHVKNCKECRSKMKRMFKSQIIENIEDIIDDNKDIIILILISFSVILFLNLINNITKN
jgi:hypothetical protein